MLVVALGLHALALFTPIPSEPPPRPKSDVKEPVKLTQLSKTAAPQLRPTVQRQLPTVNRPKPAISTPAPASKPKAEATGKAASKTQTDPFADFPHVSPSTPDCFGRGLGDNCRIVAAPLETVVAYFRQALPARKYQFAVEESGNGRAIFRIAKGYRQGYLSILTDSPTTVYVIAEQPVKNLEMLKGAVVVPPELYQLIGALVPSPDPNDPAATNLARREQFAQPDLFFKPSADPDAVPEGLPGLDGSPSLVPGQTPLSLYAAIAPSLNSIFETVSTSGNYAGGPLYTLKKGSTLVYLSLTPSQAIDGTIISVWLRDPR
jgi:hypothetical protein